LPLIAIEHTKFNRELDFRKEQILIAIDRALEWKNMRKELRELKEGKKR
jgi:hypothetical protein